MNSNALPYLKCENRIKARKYGYCGWENSARNFLVLVILKLVYLVAHDNFMAAMNVLYINDIQLFFFSSFLDPAFETRLYDVG